MAEYVEVINNRERMCDSHGNDCRECALSITRNNNNETCSHFMRNHPAEAEKIIMDWVKEHPPMTNADKFREVFGVDIDDSYGCRPLLLGEKCKSSECEDCEYDDFWSNEYKDPKNEH